MRVRVPPQAPLLWRGQLCPAHRHRRSASVESRLDALSRQHLGTQAEGGKHLAELDSPVRRRDEIQQFYRPASANQRRPGGAVRHLLFD